MNSVRFLLLPFVPFYALIVWCRNFLFDKKILPSQKTAIPSICIGNICTGGSGKTPHIEYLIRLLKDHYKISTLSRGYGRKTKGFILAEEGASAKQIGDEPMQFFHKFKDIHVSVDENRRHAIQCLKTKAPDTEVILLDDAFQHRYLKAGLNILLTDYFSPYYNDCLLPAGNLREQKSASRRADIIIVTKSPKILSPITRESILEEIKPQYNQSVYFSYINHGQLTLPSGEQCVINKDVQNHFIVLSGIHNPYPLIDYLREYTKDIKLYEFGDHHNFSKYELQRVRQHYLDYFCNHKYIVTTEKDYMRLKDSPAFEVIADLPICYVPIEVEFHKEDKNNFDQQILDYVRKNKASH